jgi:1-acyl-sn-glycerol-3-phosphate acyltransferase
VVIGPAIDTAGLTPEQVTQRVEDWIEGEMERLTPPAAVANSPASLRYATPLDKGA